MFYCQKLKQIYIPLIICFLISISSPAAGEVSATSQALGNELLNSFRELYYKNSWQKSRIVIAIVVDMSIGSRHFGYDNFTVNEDIKSLEDLAKADDEFAISVLSIIKSSRWRQKALERQELMIVRVSKLSFDEKEAIFLKAIENGDFGAYKILENLYYEHDRKDKFCELNRRMFNAFGLTPFSANFVLDGYTDEVFKLLHANCGIFDKTKSRRELLKAINTEEAKLISAQLYLKDLDYNTAFKMFTELSKSDNLTITVNADFCRGMMMYHGKGGIKEDKETALELLRNSMHNGFFTAFSPAPEIRKIILPKDKVIRSLLSSNICKNIYDVKQ
jgi:hypothetical protein